jgi:ABC-type lipoprotein export system ATPase subunit
MIRGPSGFFLLICIGGGKTTFLNIIGSIDDSTSGSLSLFLFTF